MNANLQPVWYVESTELKEMLFPQAAEVWLATRTPYISEKSYYEYEINVRKLSAFFGQTKLGDISADQIRAYQQMRLAECGPSGVNHECSVLQQMLKRVGLWDGVRPNYEPIPLPKETRGRALSPEERTKLFEAAQTSSNWEAAFLFAMLSINTTAGPKEIATLRLKDVDLVNRLIVVQPGGAKNVHRVRPIPLNEEAFKATTLAGDRAKRLGSTAPEHYLFPFRINRALFDPTRHQTSFKVAWLKMTAAAGLENFRMYDLRHHAITVMLENPSVSEETVEAVAGHVSKAMQRRYSHVRMTARRAAVSAIDGSSFPLFAPEPPRLREEQERLREQGPLTNEIVLEWLNCGLDAEIVVAKIKKVKRQNCAFDTSTESLKQLKVSGVPSSVILAMVKAA